MRKKILGMAVLCAALAMAGCRHYQNVSTEETLTISESFDKLVIISRVGDIDIVQADNESAPVGLAAHKFASGSSKKKAQEYLDLIEISYAVDNNTCTITVRMPDNERECASGGADLVLSGIKPMPVSITLNVGDITCDNITRSTIKNNVGDITITEASGAIDYETDTGDIDVELFNGSQFRLRTDVGAAAIRVSDNGTLDGSIMTGVGDITCQLSKNSSTAAQLKTGVGKIDISGISNAVISGFISLAASFELGAAEGSISMETGTGDIEVTVF